MNQILVRNTLLAALVTCGLLAGTAAAQTTTCEGAVYNCFLLRVAAADYGSVMSGYALTFEEDVLTDDPRLVLVTGPTNVLPETTLAAVQADPDVISFEVVEMTAVTEGAVGAGVDSADPAFQTALASTGTHTGPESAYFSTTLWNGYMNQPATTLINLAQTHAQSTLEEALGSGIVAVIDTGVDPDHPLLQGALMPGYDFILDQPGASEWDALDPVVHATTQQDLQNVADQSYATLVDGDAEAFIEQSYATLVDQSYATLVDQSYATLVDSKDLPPGFGHGTMIAGLIRLVAPAATIMPLRAFDGMGQGDIGNIVDAIYWAVDNGAQVINMSFSTSTYSPELLQAINHASLKKVVCITSAGNAASPHLTYPAAFSNVLGVASTDQLDVKSDFTSYGSGFVSLAAPGEALITTFPGGLYAAAWGTSFSAALVSGATALTHAYKDYAKVKGVEFPRASAVFSHGSVQVSGSGLGAGRLDALASLHCGRGGSFWDKDNDECTYD